MIRRCIDEDFESIYLIVNDAAGVYKGVIPSDCWSEPYMPRDELRAELNAGVVFLCREHEGEIAGVMGIQAVADVTLIRHAYVRPSMQNQGIGGGLLSALRERSRGPLLIGTWAAATWAIHFYEKHGFRLVPPDEKVRLLRKYWTVGDRQIETSVVLADASRQERQSAS